MPSPQTLVAVAMMVSLTFYVLLGGADYGGGVWDLLARGPRAKQQRELIAHAIGPVWEANHVWLILVVVVLFTAFPPVFALISVSLHTSLLLMLVGIVLRGSAFTFRTYDAHQERWGRWFSVSSVITPVLLGMLVGAISSNEIRVPGGGVLAPFPLAVGLLAVVLFAFLAAVYLALEAESLELQNDFRQRAIAAELIAGLVALAVFLLAKDGAPDIRERLARSWWTWPLQGSTAILAVGTIWSLWVRRFAWARLCAAGQVTMILWGWGLAQYPYLVRPELTIDNSSAPPSILRLLLWALAAGGLVLSPSYWYLLRTFNRVRR